MNQEKFYKNSLKSLLFEQEGEADEAEEAPAEEPEEEAQDEETEDSAEEGSDSPAAEGEKDDNDESQVDVQPGLDGEIEAVLIDFETSARKSAIEEGKSLKLLYETEEILDLDSFTADVARLVKNYDNLIDMEALLVNKTKAFLEDRYGEEAVGHFIEKLEQQHDIEDPTNTLVIPTSDQTPLAVGAGAGGE